MNRLAAFARHPAVRASFAAVALGLASWAIASDWRAVRAALEGVGWWATALAAGASVAYVLATLESWRAVMRAVAAPLPWGAGARIFLVSQVGKYIPGGVWNVVAGAELARDRGISRARTATALAVTMLISILTGLALAGIAAAVAPHGWPWWVRLAGLLTPLALAAASPRVLTRIVNAASRRMRLTPLERPLTWAGSGAAAGWGAAAWVLAGLQVWVIAVALGLPATAGTVALASGGFAAPWLVGFAVLVLPSGLGARELVLFPVFGAYLANPQIVALALVSRVLFTVADIVLAAVPMLWRETKRGAEPPRAAASD